MRTVKSAPICFAVIASVWMILLLSGTAHTKAGQPTEKQLTEQLTETVAKVRTGTTPAARTESAQHLAELTHGIDPKEIDDGTISDLVSLMDLSDDGVRYWVARSLGNLGPRAKVAIPKLKGILTEVDCLQGSKTSASGIRFALGRMGVKPPPPTCTPPSKLE
jgi:hypothetical protein